MEQIPVKKGDEKVKYNFPENLYTDVRIESRKSACFVLEDEDVKTNSEVETITAMIRVFDGKMWYTSQTDDIENIQDKIKENAEQKAEREENEYTERKDILSNKDLKKPNFLDVSDEKWIDSSADERHYLLFNYVINNKPPKDTKIDKEKWKNATNHERFKMLFN